MCQEGEPQNWLITQKVPSSAHYRWFLLQIAQKQKLALDKLKVYEDLTKFDLSLVALFTQFKEPNQIVLEDLFHSLISLRSLVYLTRLKKEWLEGRKGEEKRKKKEKEVQDINMIRIGKEEVFQYFVPPLRVFKFHQWTHPVKQHAKMQSQLSSKFYETFKSLGKRLYQVILEKPQQWFSFLKWFKEGTKILEGVDYADNLFDILFRKTSEQVIKIVCECIMQENQQALHFYLPYLSISQHLIDLEQDSKDLIAQLFILSETKQKSTQFSLTKTQVFQRASKIHQKLCQTPSKLQKNESLLKKTQKKMQILSKQQIYTQLLGCWAQDTDLARFLNLEVEKAQQIDSFKIFSRFYERSISNQSQPIIKSQQDVSHFIRALVHSEKEEIDLQALNNLYEREVFWSDIKYYLLSSERVLFQFIVQESMQAIIKKDFSTASILTFPFLKLRKLIALILWDLSQDKLELLQGIIKFARENVEGEDESIQYTFNLLEFVLNLSYPFEKILRNFFPGLTQESIFQSLNDLISQNQLWLPFYLQLHALPLLTCKLMIFLHKSMRNIVPKEGRKLKKQIEHDLQVQAGTFATKLAYLVVTQKKSCENEDMLTGDLIRTLGFFLNEIENKEIKTGVCSYLIGLIFTQDSLLFNQKKVLEYLELISLHCDFDKQLKDTTNQLKTRIHLMASSLTPFLQIENSYLHSEKEQLQIIQKKHMERSLIKEFFTMPMTKLIRKLKEGLNRANLEAFLDQVLESQGTLKRQELIVQILEKGEQECDRIVLQTQLTYLQLSQMMEKQASEEGVIKKLFTQIASHEDVEDPNVPFQESYIAINYLSYYSMMRKLATLNSQVEREEIEKNKVQKSLLQDLLTYFSEKKVASELKRRGEKAIEEIFISQDSSSIQKKKKKRDYLRDFLSYVRKLASIAKCSCKELLAQPLLQFILNQIFYQQKNYKIALDAIRESQISLIKVLAKFNPPIQSEESLVFEEELVEQVRREKLEISTEIYDLKDELKFHFLALAMQLSNEPQLKGYAVNLDEVMDDKIRFFQEIRLKMEQDLEEKKTEEEQKDSEIQEEAEFNNQKMLSESFQLDQKEKLFSDTESIAASECVHRKIDQEKQLSYDRFQGLIRGMGANEEKKEPEKELKSFQEFSKLMGEQKANLKKGKINPSLKQAMEIEIFQQTRENQKDEENSQVIRSRKLKHQLQLKRSTRRLQRIPQELEQEPKPKEQEKEKEIKNKDGYYKLREQNVSIKEALIYLEDIQEYQDDFEWSRDQIHLLKIYPYVDPSLRGLDVFELIETLIDQFNYVALRYLIKSSDKIRRNLQQRYTDMLVQGFMKQVNHVQDSTFQKRMDFMDEIGVLMVKNEEELFDIHIDILAQKLLGNAKSQDFNSRQLSMIRKIQEYVVVKLYKMMNGDWCLQNPLTRRMREDELKNLLRSWAIFLRLHQVMAIKYNGLKQKISWLPSLTLSECQSKTVISRTVDLLLKEDELEAAVDISKLASLSGAERKSRYKMAKRLCLMGEYRKAIELLQQHFRPSIKNDQETHDENIFNLKKMKSLTSQLLKDQEFEIPNQGQIQLKLNYLSALLVKRELNQDPRKLFQSGQIIYKKEKEFKEFTDRKRIGVLANQKLSISVDQKREALKRLDKVVTALYS